MKREVLKITVTTTFDPQYGYSHIKAGTDLIAIRHQGEFYYTLIENLGCLPRGRMCADELGMYTRVTKNLEKIS